MSEPCVCDGSGMTPSGYCCWCNAGEAHRKATQAQAPRIVFNSNKRTQPTTQNRYVLSEPITVTADHKDTTEPHE